MPPVELSFAQTFANTGDELASSRQTTTQTAEQNDTTLVELFDAAQESVVQVSTSSTDPGTSFRSSLGSGFVYDDLGHVITNYHVIAGSNGQNVDVTFSDGTVYRAEIVGTDPYSDLAVLEIIDDNFPADKLAPLPISNSSALEVGQQVAAIGNPFGLSGSMTSGIVSGLNRLLPAQAPSNPGLTSHFSIPDVIQMDAPINPGNSGGPLLNMEGEVVGITTAIYSTTGSFAGVGFAVPSNAISKIVPVLIEEGSFQHSWLGISGTDMTSQIADAIGLEEPRGFLVIDVVEGSPADDAGMQGGDKLGQIGGREIKLGGDVILDIDDKPVRKIDDLLGYLEAATEVGETANLTLWRDGTIIEANATLEARPDPSAMAS